MSDLTIRPSDLKMALLHPQQRLEGNPQGLDSEEKYDHKDWGNNVFDDVSPGIAQAFIAHSNVEFRLGLREGPVSNEYRGTQSANHE